jgi:hypothetical protein
MRAIYNHEKAAKKAPSEFTAGGDENRQRTQIGPLGKMTMSQLRDVVNLLGPTNPALYQNLKVS